MNSSNRGYLSYFNALHIGSTRAVLTQQCSDRNFRLFQNVNFQYIVPLNTTFLCRKMFRLMGIRSTWSADQLRPLLQHQKRNCGKLRCTSDVRQSSRTYHVIEPSDRNITTRGRGRHRPVVEWGQTHSEVSVDTKHQTLQGVAFPVEREAFQALSQLKSRKLNYVQLKIDIQNEIIVLANTAYTEVKDLPARVPKDAARYHFFLYRHSHEGDYLDSIVFIYSMPGYNCSIRERMLYSSCKSPLLDVIEKQLMMEIVKKLEIDNGDELTPDFLYDEVHPKQHAHKQNFAKPKGPAGKRGIRRLIRGPAEAETAID
ncbi:unnamed protein product [Ranitomeya imitator]|uniref:Twinfilin-1 n=1 Tax=Ranitomeya imitator TaxID=111125 RepID=A0ABN9KN45_9NEOB|nr:unnamed protein product [Ranitomeya imitator]